MTEPAPRRPEKWEQTRAAIATAVAAEPKNPLSPFGPGSEPARKASVALRREVVDGSGLVTFGRGIGG